MVMLDSGNQLQSQQADIPHLEGQGSRQETASSAGFKALFPRMNVHDGPSSYRLHIAFDGLDVMDLECRLDRNSVWVSGFLTADGTAPSACQVVMHRFSRRLQLPEADTACKPRYSRDNGRVTITIDKAGKKFDAK